MTLLAMLAFGLVAQGDPVQEMHDLVARAQKAQSYTFEVQTAEEGGGFGRRGGSQGPAAPLAGRYQKGKPVWLQSGDSLGFRAGEHLVYQDADGTWKALDPRAVGRGRGGFGDEGRPAPGAEGQPSPDAPAGAEDDPQAANRRAAMNRMLLLRAPLPHALLADLDTGATEVSCEAAEGRKTFRGQLSPEAAAKFATGGLTMGGRAGRGAPPEGAPAGPVMENSGSFVLVVSEAGVVESLSIETVTRGTFRDQEFERKRTTDVKVAAVNSTEVEVPAEAAAALAEAAKAPAVDEIF